MNLSRMLGGVTDDACWRRRGDNERGGKAPPPPANRRYGGRSGERRGGARCRRSRRAVRRTARDLRSGGTCPASGCAGRPRRARQPSAFGVWPPRSSRGQGNCRGCSHLPPTPWLQTLARRTRQADSAGSGVVPLTAAGLDNPLAWQHCPHRGAMAWLALDRQRPAMEGQQFPADCQPEATAAKFRPMEASACWNGWPSDSSAAASMPMPVSVTTRANPSPECSNAARPPHHVA